MNNQLMLVSEEELQEVEGGNTTLIKMIEFLVRSTVIFV